MSGWARTGKGLFSLRGIDATLGRYDWMTVIWLMTSAGLLGVRIDGSQRITSMH